MNKILGIISILVIIFALLKALKDKKMSNVNQMTALTGVILLGIALSM